MPPVQIDLDIEAMLVKVEQDLAGKPAAGKLRTIRNLFDDASFVAQVRDLLARRHNDPQKYEIPNAIIRIMRRAEELRDERERDRETIKQMAVGAGTGLLVGSIIACLNPVIGLFALIPAAGGMVVGGASWFGVRRLEQERTLYRQIAERLAVISKALE